MKRRLKLSLLAEIAIILIIKLCLLYGIWFYFFHPTHQKLDTDHIAERMLTQPHTQGISP